MMYGKCLSLQCAIKWNILGIVFYNSTLIHKPYARFFRLVEHQVFPRFLFEMTLIG